MQRCNYDAQIATVHTWSFSIKMNLSGRRLLTAYFSLITFMHCYVILRCVYHCAVPSQQTCSSTESYGCLWWPWRSNCTPGSKMDLSSTTPGHRWQRCVFLWSFRARAINILSRQRCWKKPNEASVKDLLMQHYFSGKVCSTWCEDACCPHTWMHTYQVPLNRVARW